jgi:thiamine-phosphate pyrophosphorylase
VTLPSVRPLIYFISDGTITDENYERRSAELLELIKAAVLVRVPLVQIREKCLSGRNLFDLASRAVATMQDSRTCLLINDRLDVALASGANGVHLTSRSFSPDAVRQVAPDGFLIGVSAHNEQEIENAEARSADFVVFGPIFKVPGKRAEVGLEKLKSVARTFDQFPLIALGGINENNYRNVLDTSAAGFAAIRFLNDAANLEMLSKDFDL